MALYLLALHLGRLRGTLDRRALPRAAAATCAQCPRLIERALARASRRSRSWRARSRTRSDFLFLGRGVNYPIALEGALKLKEISYIHAEGYPAGEMKHGPIALIDEKLPVVVLRPPAAIYEKMLSNMKEVRARGGRVIAVAAEGDGARRAILRPTTCCSRSPRRAPSCGRRC